MRKHKIEKTYTREKGSALFTASAVVFLLILLGTALVSVSLQALHQTRQTQQAILAFNIAESGADRAVRWLKDQPYPPPGTAPFDPFGTQPLAGGTYRVTVFPATNNPGALQKTYTLVSEGTFGSRTERVSIVLRLQSFAKYAYFTDSEVSSISGGRIWFFSGDRIRGPAHSNNRNGSNFQIHWGAGAEPIFDDLVTSAASFITYAPRNPNSEEDFLRIYRTGSRGFRLNVDPIPLPDSTTMQREAAWGNSSGFPTSNGVYVRPEGGIFVRGSCSILLRVDANDNQQFVITQGSTVTTVTVDLRTGYRYVDRSGQPRITVPGTGTGVLYCTSHITSLSGTVANNLVSVGYPPTVLARSAYTIATDVNAGADITITNPIRYQSQPDPSLPINHPTNLRPGTLGLIARNVIVSSAAPQFMEINAVILAGSSSTPNGSFYVANYNTRTPPGTLRLLGGVIQKARGPVGTFNTTTGQIVTGYAKDYYYDPRLADLPPPYYPTTGLYDVLSWQRLTQENE
ncbi:MAG: pilus assembly PilX N-terminal domain-containing protein [Candidatus Caldarchaeum sp.]